MDVGVKPINSVVLATILCMQLMTGCKAPQVACDPSMVSRQIEDRTGMTMERVLPCQTRVPDSVILEDGLCEDEAVLTALSNNSAFQSTLALLGTAGGDAVQATLLTNPQFLTYFPTGAKEGQYTLYAPIESYFLRPARVKVANREYRDRKSVV